MKKSLSLLLAAALICTLAAGCGTEEALVQTAPPTEVPAPLVLEDTPEVKQYEGVKLTFHSRWGEDALDAGVLTQAAELFEATTGAVVEIQWQAGEGGDIFQLPASQLSQCQEQVLDLTQMAQAAGYESRSIECLVDLARSGEVLLAIPQTPYVSGFYYNRAVFEACGITEMPGTYDEFLNLCAALAAGGYSPLTLDTESADELLALHLTQYLGAEGAAQMLAKGGWTEDELALQATVDIWDFVKAGYLTYATPAAYPAGQNRIGSSNSAMVYGTNALCAQVEAQTMTEISWGMFPYPGVAGAERIISVDADVLAISSGCENPQAAFDFIMLLVTGEFDQLRADVTNGIPADPNNISPVAGAVEAMQVTQIVEPAQPALDDQQLSVVLKLWQGKYKENDDFAQAMDKLYVK